MNIVLLGSGNLAMHLARAFEDKGWNLVQIWSRHLEHAKELAQLTKGEAIGDLSAIDLMADLYVIAVKDSAIAEVSEALKGVAGMVVHTSGSTPMSVLKSHKRYGVLYPLQTFSKTRQLDFKKVPLCIEAINTEAFEQLDQIARSLSDVVAQTDSSQRKVLHLAAVFACNFTNHLYQLSKQLLEVSGMDFDLLTPLIKETADKVTKAEPKEVQTGPAIRGDEVTMNAHLAMLEGQGDLQEIYTILSRSIKKTSR